MTLVRAVRECNTRPDRLASWAPDAHAARRATIHGGDFLPDVRFGRGAPVRVRRTPVGGDPIGIVVVPSVELVDVDGRAKRSASARPLRGEDVDAGYVAEVRAVRREVDGALIGRDGREVLVDGCATIIDLLGNGDGPATLRYFAN